MTFLNSYKHLDNLCKSFSDYPKGVTSYIEAMDAAYQTLYKCAGWQSDYERLKKYRHIRTRIAHDNDVYEEDLCDRDDAEWLEKFCSRILEQTDPLSQYERSKRMADLQAAKARIAAKAQKTTAPQQDTNLKAPSPTRKTRRPLGCGACLSLLAALSLAAWWLIFHM